MSDKNYGNHFFKEQSVCKYCTETSSQKLIYPLVVNFGRISKFQSFGDRYPNPVVQGYRNNTVTTKHDRKLFP